MTKSDKHSGRTKPKHLPELEPSRLEPKRKRYAKPAPRYTVEMWYEAFLRAKLGEGYWVRIGSAKTLDEAIHIMGKPSREFWSRLQKKRGVRIIDTETGCVVRSIEVGYDTA